MVMIIYISLFESEIPDHKNNHIFCANATKIALNFLHIEKIIFSLFFSFFLKQLFFFHRNLHKKFCFCITKYIFVIFCLFG